VTTSPLPLRKSVKKAAYRKPIIDLSTKKTTIPDREKTKEKIKALDQARKSTLKKQMSAIEVY